MLYEIHPLIPSVFAEAVVPRLPRAQVSHSFAKTTLARGSFKELQTAQWLQVLLAAKWMTLLG